jgi:hypothetical protein
VAGQHVEVARKLCIGQLRAKQVLLDLKALPAQRVIPALLEQMDYRVPTVQ